MKRIIYLLLALTASLAATSAAQATTITFGTFAGPGDFVNVGTTYTESGYRFESDDFIKWRDGSLHDSDPTGSTGLALNDPFSTTTMTRIGGGAFNLTSIDVDDVFHNGSFHGPLDYTYTLAGGGTGTGSFVVDDVPGYSTLMLNLADLVSFAFTPGTDLAFVQFDNVIVTDVGGVAVTPLPGALPLFATVIASAGIVAARKRRNGGIRAAEA